MKQYTKETDKVVNKCFEKLAVAEQQIKELKETFIEYFNTEGCSCCEDTEGHKKAEDKLAKLFNVPRYKDDSGNDWKQALTLKNKT